MNANHFLYNFNINSLFQECYYTSTEGGFLSPELSQELFIILENPMMLSVAFTSPPGNI